MSGGSLFNSFDETEFGGNSSEQSEVDQIEVSLDEVIDDYDEEMDEAEQKINLAGYYRVLVKGGLFKNDTSEAAKIVDAEVRAFAKERMAALLNLTSKKEEKKIELPFTDTQISVLQWLADRYYEKQQQAPQSQPMMRPLAPPTQPQALQAQQPKIPQVVPLTSPKAGAMDLVASRKPSKKTQEVKRQPTVQKTAKGKTDYSLIADNTPFEENGNTYKLVTNPETKERIKLKVHKDKKISSPHRLPMPSAQAMVSLSEAKAHEALATTERVVEQATGSLTRRQ